jgi:cell division protein FtsA
MEGLMELAEEILHMPVRIGVPQTVSGLADVVRNPIYATGVGLLLFGHRHMHERGAEAVSGGGFKAVWERMKSWFQGNF